MYNREYAVKFSSSSCDRTISYMESQRICSLLNLYCVIKKLCDLLRSLNHSNWKQTSFSTASIIMSMHSSKPICIWRKVHSNHLIILHYQICFNKWILFTFCSIKRISDPFRIEFRSKYRIFGSTGIKNGSISQPELPNPFNSEVFRWRTPTQSKHKLEFNVCI